MTGARKVRKQPQAAGTISSHKYGGSSWGYAWKWIKGNICKNWSAIHRYLQEYGNTNVNCREKFQTLWELTSANGDFAINDKREDKKEPEKESEIFGNMSSQPFFKVEAKWILSPTKVS